MGEVKSELKRIRTNVLVIGGGGSGARAAIEASRHIDSVYLVTKGSFGKTGCTPIALGGLAAPFGHADSRDNWEIHFKDTLIGGGLLNNQRLAEIMCKEAPERVREVESWGSAFDRAGNKFYQRQLGGHTYPRTLTSGDEIGRELMVGLVNQCRARKNIRIMDDVYVTKLFTDRNRICGALGVELRTGEVLVFETSAVIIAVGGCGRLWEPYCIAPYGKIGDGLRLAYEVGAEVVDIESYQYHPTGVIWPRFLAGRLMSEGIRGEGGRLYNALGERFMERYDPSKLELATRDYTSRCIFKEVKEGRGTPHGGVWLSVAHLPPKIVEERCPTAVDRLEVAGIDMRKEPVEVRWMNHYQNGGIKVDEHWATNVKGLYAVGEVAGGVHGGNRLGSNSLPNLLVSGRRAGEDSARYAEDVGDMTVPEDKIVEELEVIRAPLLSEKGYSPYELKDLLAETMNRYVDIARNRGGLEKALEIFKGVSEKLSSLKASGRSLKLNKDWEAAIELRSRVIACEMIVRASLFREESRAAFYREDFPETDRKHWDCNVVVKCGGDAGMLLEKVPLVATILDPKEAELPPFPTPGR